MPSSHPSLRGDQFFLFSTAHWHEKGADWRVQENIEAKGGMGGRHAATTQGFYGKEGVLLAASYLSSQSLANPDSLIVFFHVF